MMNGGEEGMGRPPLSPSPTTAAAGLGCWPTAHPHLQPLQHQTPGGTYAHHSYHHHPSSTSSPATPYNMLGPAGGSWPIMTDPLPPSPSSSSPYPPPSSPYAAYPSAMPATLPMAHLPSSFSSPSSRARSPSPPLPPSTSSSSPSPSSSMTPGWPSSSPSALQVPSSPTTAAHTTAQMTGWPSPPPAPSMGGHPHYAQAPGAYHPLPLPHHSSPPQHHPHSHPHASSLYSTPSSTSSRSMMPSSPSMMSMPVMPTTSLAMPSHYGGHHYQTTTSSASSSPSAVYTTPGGTHVDGTMVSMTASSHRAGAATRSPSPPPPSHYRQGSPNQSSSPRANTIPSHPHHHLLQQQPSPPREVGPWMSPSHSSFTAAAAPAPSSMVIPTAVGGMADAAGAVAAQPPGAGGGKLVETAPVPMGGVPFAAPMSPLVTPLPGKRGGRGGGRGSRGGSGARRGRKLKSPSSASASPSLSLEASSPSFPGDHSVRNDAADGGKDDRAPSGQNPSNSLAQQAFELGHGKRRRRTASQHPRQDETESSSSEAEQEDVKSSARKIKDEHDDETETERRLRRGWEKERSEIAWRWTWLQLQIAEMMRQGAKLGDKQERKQRNRKRNAASSEVASEADSRPAEVVPTTRRLKVSRVRLGRQNPNKPPVPAHFDTETAPHPLFTFVGLYTRRKPPPIEQPASDAPDVAEPEVQAKSADIVPAAPPTTIPIIAEVSNKNGVKKKSKSSKKHDKRQPKAGLSKSAMSNATVKTSKSQSTLKLAKSASLSSKKVDLRRTVSGSETQLRPHSSSSKSSKKKRKHTHLRSSDYDINNYISIGSSSTVITEQLRVEDIFTPTWRSVESPEGSHTETDSQTLSSDEDTSDETFALRHFEFELLERRRYLAPKLELQKKRMRRRGGGGSTTNATHAPTPTEASTTLGAGDSNALSVQVGDASDTAKIESSNELLGVAPPRNGSSLRLRPMSQEISSLAALLPIKGEHSTPDDDAKRRLFLKQRFEAARNTYLNPERKQVQRWQPRKPPQPAPETKNAEDTNVNAEPRPCSDSAAVDASSMPVQHQGYIYDDGASFLLEDSEDDDDDSAEDLFLPGGSSAKGKKNRKKSSSRSHSRGRGQSKGSKIKGQGKGGIAIETSIRPSGSRELRRSARRQPFLEDLGIHTADDEATTSPLFSLPMDSIESRLFALDGDEDKDDDDEFIVEEEAEEVEAEEDLEPEPLAPSDMDSEVEEEEEMDLGDDEGEDEVSFDEGDEEDCLRFKWEVITRTSSQDVDEGPAEPPTPTPSAPDDHHHVALDPPGAADEGGAQRQQQQQQQHQQQQQQQQEQQAPVQRNVIVIKRTPLMV